MALTDNCCKRQTSKGAYILAKPQPGTAFMPLSWWNFCQREAGTLGMSW